MSTNAERVRRFRERQRAAHPKEPNWRDLEGRLKVVALWLGQGHEAPDGFLDGIRAVVGLEPPAAGSEPRQPESDSLDEWLQQILKPVSSRARQQVEKGLKRLLARLRDDYQREVQQGIDKRVAEQRERLTALEQEVRAEHDAVTKMRQGIMAYMTEDEYNLIRGLLHPGRHPGDEQDRYTKAFTIFKRLKEMIHPEISRKVLRARGWA